MLLRLTIICLIAALTLLRTGHADDAKAPPRFNRDVRPILSDACFKCHGPDGQTRQADLRLDQREGLLGVTPGSLAESELWRRITSDDPDAQMPPADSGKSLTAEQRDTLQRWIEAGAAWEDHWAFIPPQRPALPAIDARAWPRNAIDVFILAELERRGMTPLMEGAPETLVRRVTLDLTGLPATPDEVDHYLSDPSPDRFERLVDRLLASPRYGEQMAVAWLDGARYADTSGYQNDGPREMWRWRDWVIDALNAGMPFDQFTVEQLAGDLLPGATLSQLVATGFNRNHRGNAEGGIIPEEYAVEYVVDRVDTTGAVWLGLTIGCARCHAHKYDPISHEEYYRLFAYFNNVPEHGRAIKEGNSPPYIKTPTDDQARRLAEMQAEGVAAQRQWQALAPQGRRAQTAWEDHLNRQPGADWTVTEGLAHHFPLDEENFSAESLKGVGGEMQLVEAPQAKAALFTGESYLDAGDCGGFGYFDPFSVSAWVRPGEGLSGGIVSRMSDDSDSDGWALHLEDGRVQVNLSKRWLDDALRVETTDRLNAGQWQHVVMTYDGSRTADGVAIYVNGALQAKRVQLDALNQSFASDQPLRIGSTGALRRFQGAIGDVRIYSRALSPQEAAILATPDSLDAIAKISRADRSAGQAAKLAAAFLATAAPAPIRQARERVQSIEAQRRALLDAIPTTMVMQEMAEPRVTRVLERGVYDRPGEVVTPGVPAALSQSAAPQGSDRLALAQWIVDPANPLTARVAVNRQWERLFGVGLVATSEDFGTQGESPSHPELLDWLACELVESGWDMKRIERLLVTSAAYRQASHVSARLASLDPENRLLARGPRFRLSAEAIRDQALAAAGLLDPRLGGPSVFPYQPEGLWGEIATVTAYPQSSGADLYRRSLYSYGKRTVSHPAMAAFDAPNREACVVRRSRTNTPLQALTLLNDITFVEAARKLAERVIREGGAGAEPRLTLAFRLVVGRMPQPAEMSVLHGALAKHRARFEADPSQAEQLLQVGESPADDSIPSVELAAYAAVMNVILNLDEAVTRE